MRRRGVAIAEQNPAAIYYALRAVLGQLPDPRQCEQEVTTLVRVRYLHHRFRKLLLDC